MRATYVADITLARIRFAPLNPRTDGDANLGGMRASYQIGLATYPSVMEVGKDWYEVLDGERRVRSALAEGSETLPCVVYAEKMSSGQVLLLRLLANEHRLSLDPADEAAALKAGWLIANAQAMQMGDQADALLSQAESLVAVLVPLQTLLDTNAFDWRQPPVSQAVWVQQMGLGMSAASLRKKLQLLNAPASVQAAVRELGLTAAARRALFVLGPADQEVLITAAQDDTALVCQVRTIVQGVQSKKRSIHDAISIAQGHVPGMPPPAARASAPQADQDTGNEASPDADADVSASRPGAGVDESQAMDAVLPLIEAAQTLQTHCATLASLLGTLGLSALPAPWDDYAQDALGLISQALAPIQVRP